MTPARRWRRGAVGVVVAADVLMLLLAALTQPWTGVVLALPLAALTFWALRAPAGWGALLLLVGQVLTVGLSGILALGLAGWALAAVAGLLLLVTHLALALLAAFPPGAGLPSATLRRWAGQAAVLAAGGAAVAVAGFVATRSPTSWGLPVLAAATVALAALAALTWRSTRRAR
ncbi:hypothetical protein [Phycicoccus avicenniae]|uniref:hypothetical protein n=1 Tax=Phycicoccus avicenniae TaxID=2828860 RepID=UPI003D2CBA11